MPIVLNLFESTPRFNSSKRFCRSRKSFPSDSSSSSGGDSGISSTYEASSCSSFGATSRRKSSTSSAMSQDSPDQSPYNCRFRRHTRRVERRYFRDSDTEDEGSNRIRFRRDSQIIYLPYAGQKYRVLPSIFPSIVMRDGVDLHSSVEVAKVPVDDVVTIIETAEDSERKRLRMKVITERKEVGWVTFAIFDLKEILLDVWTEEV